MLLIGVTDSPLHVLRAHLVDHRVEVNLHHPWPGRGRTEGDWRVTRRQEERSTRVQNVEFWRSRRLPCRRRSGRICCRNCSACVVARIKIEGGLPLRARQVRLIHRKIYERQRKVSLRRVFQLEGSLELARGFMVLALSLERLGQQNVGLGIIRRQRTTSPSSRSASP